MASNYPFLFCSCCAQERQHLEGDPVPCWIPSTGKGQGQIKTRCFKIIVMQSGFISLTLLVCEIFEMSFSHSNKIPFKESSTYSVLETLTIITLKLEGNFQEFVNYLHFIPFSLIKRNQFVTSISIAASLKKQNPSLPLWLLMISWV